MNAPQQPPGWQREGLATLFDRRPDEGIYRVDRSVYTDPAILELEMEHILWQRKELRDLLPIQLLVHLKIAVRRLLI